MYNLIQIWEAWKRLQMMIRYSYSIRQKKLQVAYKKQFFFALNRFGYTQCTIYALYLVHSQKPTMPEFHIEVI